MAAVRHLEFSKVGNFNFRSYSEAQYASPIQISQRSVEPFRRYGRFSILKMAAAAILDFGNFKSTKSPKPRLRYGDFSFFQDGCRPPSWIFKSWKFQLPVPFGGPICVTEPNFAKIGRTVPEIWPIFDFQDGGGRHLVYF